MNPHFGICDGLGWASDPNVLTEFFFLEPCFEFGGPGLGCGLAGGLGAGGWGLGAGGWGLGAGGAGGAGAEGGGRRRARAAAGAGAGAAAGCWLGAVGGGC